MNTAIALQLSASGGPQVSGVFRGAAMDAKALQKQLDDDAKAADVLAKAFARIEALQKHAETMRRAAAAAKAHATANQGDATALKAAEVATRKHEAAVRSLNNALVRAGQVAHWAKGAGDAHRMAANTRRAADALRQFGAAGSQAGSQVAGGLQHADSATGRLITKLQTLGGKLKDLRADGVGQGIDAAQGIGTRMTVAGGAGLALAGKMVMDAGRLERMKAGVRNTIDLQSEGKSPSEVKTQSDNFFRQLQEFDKRSVMDLPTAMDAAQSAMARGFKPGELLNNAGTGLMDKISNAVTLAGGDRENFTQVFRQLADIKGQKKAEKTDLNAITEGGKVPIWDMLEKFVTKERFAEIRSGQPGTGATDKEVFGALEQGLGNPKYAKANKEMMEGFLGQLDIFNGLVFQLSASFGETLLPTMITVTKSAVWLADTLKALPGPIKSIIVWGGILVAGSVAIKGASLLVRGSLARAALDIAAYGAAQKAGGAAAAAAAVPVRGLALKSLPLLGTAALRTAGTIGLAIGVMMLVAAVWKKYADELKKPTETTRDGRTHEEAQSDALNSANVLNTVKAARNDPNLNTRGKIAVLQAASLKMGDLGFTEEALRLSNERAQLAKNAPPSAAAGHEKYVSQISGLTANWRMSQVAVKKSDDKTPEEKAADKSKAEIDTLIAKIGGAPLPDDASASASPALLSATGLPSASSSDGGTINHTAQIRALEDRRDALKGKKGEAATRERNDLNVQLKSLRRAQSDSKAAARTTAKNQEADEDIRIARLGVTNEGLVNRINAEAKVRAAREEMTLKAQLKQIDKLKDSKVLDPAKAEEQSDVLREAYERRNNLIEAENNYRVAIIEADEIFLRAEIEAANQEGEARRKTLELGKLGKEKRLAAAKSELDAQREINAMGEAQAKTNVLSALSPGQIKKIREQKSNNSWLLADVAGLYGLAEKSEGEGNKGEAQYYRRQATRLMDKMIPNLPDVPKQMLSPSQLSSAMNGGGAGAHRYNGGVMKWMLGSGVGYGAMSSDAMSSAMRGGAAADYRAGGAQAAPVGDFAAGGGNGPVEVKARVSSTQDGNKIRLSFVVEDAEVQLKPAPGNVTNRALKRNVAGAVR